MANERFQHIILENPPSVTNFTAHGGGGAKQIPDRDRQNHSAYLLRRFREAWQEADAESAVIQAQRTGVYVEFRSDPGAQLVTKSLEDMRSKKVRLLNVRTERQNDEDVTYATVYVANEQKKHFLTKIQEYASAETSKGRPKNADLVNSIADLRKALLIESFWQDDQVLIPTNDKQWCEVWLSGDSCEVRERFEQLLQRERIEAAAGHIRFPERTVKVIHANRHDLERLSSISDDIAEYRRAKETATFWLDMENREQAQWVEDLLARTTVIDDPNVAICILDTGVNNGHPLLARVLKAQDCLTVEPTWGVDDHDGHGTLMAGIAAYGDLKEHLASTTSIAVNHGLESVKLLPSPPAQTQQQLWGHVTAQAVSRAEIQAPQRSRVICMAVTATDTRDRGRATSWSGRLDQLSSGADDQLRRLFVVSAGNADLQLALNYPSAQETDSVHDPAQSWNALTVGAYTGLATITDTRLQTYTPVAQAGQLSPFSTTSATWDAKWPIKPEIVMEGGNLAHDGHGFSTECDDLSLLSTHRSPATTLLSSFNMTSAATAQAARFAAEIQHKYPDYWPETVRALMVHSAEWTPALKAQFLPNQQKTSYARLLRVCGYGVPNLDRALYSAANSLTLIAQREIQPFDKKLSGSGYKTNEMHVYDLPWPTEVLLSLPAETAIRMRVTLSYFIEPGPGEIGWKDRYRYASHGLRFDVKSPTEDTADFLKRINIASRGDEEGHPGTESASAHWMIGSIGRDKGSVHCDIWQGTAAQLATSNVISIYPVIGWWRERGHLGRWDRRTRYSLVVSITTPEQDVDIYTPVATQLGITIPI